MGIAITWAMKRLGFEVVCVDENAGAANRITATLGNKDFIFYRTKDIVKDIHEIFEYDKPDVAISSLPYHQLEKIAKYCISTGIRYCDLGGRVDVSAEINKFAKKHAAAPVITDLGLAPGWVNILTEEGFRKVNSATDVEMMVGGLPDYLQSTQNILRYTPTWSVDGLINEYRDDCLILENGEVKTVEGMKGHETGIESANLGPLEAFYTSGGGSHTIPSMKARGVSNCSYKTLRYPGHRDIVKWLIRDCKLDDVALEKVFTDGTTSKGTVHDIVVMMSKVSNKESGVSWKKEIVVKGEHLQHASSFTAMQKATAFPCAAIAKLLADKQLEGNKDQHRDYYTTYDNVLAYKDIPFKAFSSNLKLLGL